MEPLYCNIRDRGNTEDLIIKAKLDIYVYEAENNMPFITNTTKPFRGNIEMGDEHLFNLNDTEYMRIHQILSASKLLITTHLFGNMEVSVYGVRISEDRIVIDIQGSITWREDGTLAWVGNPDLKEN